jgi:NDP-sugar pyrophosphorylase family protein
MNGDLLTTLNYRVMWDAHRSSGALATMAAFQREVKIDLGVISVDEGGRVRGYMEKPTYEYTVSTGIYIFEPGIREYIPCQQQMDMPELILGLLQAGQTVRAYPFTGIWLDIGRSEDYERALAEFELHRSQFLPPG